MTKETDKMKTIKKQQNKMRIFLTIITLLIANGIWAQKNNSYSPKFKKGQSAVYEFTLEQTQSGTPDSINTMLDFSSITEEYDNLFNGMSRREPYLSCKVRLTVLNVSPFTTTIQLSLLENVNYTKKKVETAYDSLFYYNLANIMKKRPLILTFTSDMKSYIVSNSEEISADLSGALINLIYGDIPSELADPIYSYNRYATQALTRTGKPNIQFLTNLYAAYIPSLLDLIQTFSNPLTEGNITKGRPLDGTNRNMTYFASQTSRNKQGEWTYITDLDKYTTPVYDSDLDDNWADSDSVVVDSLDEDTVAVDDYDSDSTCIDTAEVDTTEWDSTEYDSTDTYSAQPDTTVDESERIAHIHTETYIGKDNWPTLIEKTITLTDNNILWTYRRKIRKVQDVKTRK
ncbi:MAG: hypothetical protein HXN76_04845 [Prevotella pallens]|jgi:hypothetical protein|uniref:hypothetical protein n=2 Tax=Prevotella pallens TaxID=60133 RepID=UPI001CB01CC9|nr:hypothetical protein [Prevotella pallens]MBF1442574.1 hypothetical protein [Prevotella pallens]MBF1457868.1 hypothetical protein [Prevotella pallens]MBF1464932.1 hypothetical protein [Prevotella pallens]MBF1485080.1 hypothetical protein [Prevotella pallens]MBF1489694.1 hypothetical protein [Prevotella pallens]